MPLIDPVSFSGPRSGPRLVVLGAVHGNETCGTRAIERVLADFADGRLALASGVVTFVSVTNRLGYERGTRNGDRNLNRHLAPTDAPRDNEDRIANELCPLLARHDVLLDLHSFFSPGRPFALVGPVDNDGALEPFGQAAREEALALRLGVDRVVDGWLATCAAGAARRGGSAAYGIGTTEYMRSVGGCAITLECGQHADPNAPEVGYRAIRNTLAHLGLVDAPDRVPTSRMEGLRLCEVTDRLHAEDVFVRHWTSFDAVRAGEPIAKRRDGTLLVAPRDGFVLFPNPNAEPGFEWFYFAERHPRLSRCVG